MLDTKKVAIIGCGFVGASSAFSLMQSGLFSSMVLIDVNKDKAEGEAMDLSHGVPFSKHMKVYAGDYDDIVDCSIIIITAGVNQKPNETRLDLIKRNTVIFKSIINEIKKRNCEGILLVVSNPVDILTYVTLKLSGFPPHRVIGSGTVLDTARLKYLLGEHLNVDSRGIHAFIIGEHGDSELAVWSSANVSGINLIDFCKLRGCHDHMETMNRFYKEVRDSAYEIIKRKEATYYGIAMALRRICEAIIRDEHSILPISSYICGHYGLDDIYMGVPTIVGSTGAERILDIPLDDNEENNLLSSAKAIREIIDKLEL